ncbi:MAG: hypothetical protein AAF458_02285 [Pseudomonadota bacterium]
MRNPVKYLWAAVLSAVTLLGFASAAQAMVTYSYTGNAFNTGLSGVYDNTNFVTIDVSFDAALGANFGVANVTGLAGFSITANDGEQTITSPVVIALMGTDAAGAIDHWVLQVGANGSGPFILSEVQGQPTDRGFIDTSNQGFAIGSPGTWVCSGDCSAGTQGNTSTAPAPAPVVLVGLGLIGLAFCRHRSFGASWSSRRPDPAGRTA